MNMLITNGPQTILTYADTTRYAPAKTILRVYRSEITDVKPTLTRLNTLGAAIAFTVNETAGRDRTIESITRVRAYFSEIDGLPEQQQKQTKLDELLNGPLSPSAIVETRNGLHAYWYSTGTEKVDAYDYRRINNRIAHQHGGDTSALDLARVLRLPGFNHVKNPLNPFPVELIYEDEAAIYTREDILSAFPTTADEHEKLATPRTEPVKLDTNTRAARYMEAALTRSANDVQTAGSGNRNTTLNACAYSLARYLHTGIITAQDIINTLKPAALQAGLPEHEVDSTLHSALNAGARRPRDIQLTKGQNE